MILKNTLKKPYTETERIHFIYTENRVNGYIIKQTDTQLESWDYTEEEKKQQQKEILMQTDLTKREIFLALYKDKGITPEEIEAKITDPEALIEFKYANTYFRGNPLIDKIGKLLGYTEEQLDNLFINKTF